MEIATDKVRVCMQMIEFSLSGEILWCQAQTIFEMEETSIFILCDAADIVDAVQKLSST